MIRLWCAVLAVACSACVLRVPGLTIGGPSPSSPAVASSSLNSGSSRPSVAGVELPSAVSPWAAGTDAQFAAKLAPEYFDQLHHITSLEKKPSGTVAVGQMGYEPSDVSVISQREEMLVRKKYASSTELDIATCHTLFVDYEGLPATDEDVQRLCADGRFAGSENLVFALRSLLKFDALVDAVGDPAKAKALRTEMARRLGWKRDAFIVEGGRWSTHLTELPLSEWSYRTLRFAQAYATKHQLDSALVESYAAALKTVPKTECVTRRGIFIRQYEGGSSYGSPTFDYPDYREPTIVPCSTTASLKTSKDDFATLPSMRPMVGTKWLGVKASGSWEVHRNELGVILNQWRTADAYWERERGD